MGPDKRETDSTEEFAATNGELPVHDSLHRWFERELYGSLNVSSPVQGELTLYDATGSWLGWISQVWY